MIKIQNLKKIYNGNTVLDIDNLGVAKGELIGLVGNNGAGKTTLLRLILDLIQADDGFVESNGQKVNESETWKEYTGSYIDGRFLIDFLTPEEYFDFIVHKALKLRQSLLQGFIVDVIDICDEIEVFLRGEEVDEESAVDVTAGIFLPRFTLVHLLSIAFHETIISLNQVENQTEQGGLARTIITYESYQLALCNTQIINIEYGIAIIYLLEKNKYKRMEKFMEN